MAQLLLRKGRESHLSSVARGSGSLRVDHLMGLTLTVHAWLLSTVSLEPTAWAPSPSGQPAHLTSEP